MAILIKDGLKGANVSVASVNGYTKDKVILAKRYLKEIGNNRRTFPIERLVEMYNEVKGTNDKPQGCKPCQATKYYNGLQNYAYFGELTLVNTNKCTKDELDINLIDQAALSGMTDVNELKQEVSAINDELEEERKKEAMKERMAKARAARKINKEKNGKD